MERENDRPERPKINNPAKVYLIPVVLISS